LLLCRQNIFIFLLVFMPISFILNSQELNEQVLEFDDIQIRFKQDNNILQGRKNFITIKIMNTGNDLIVFGTGMQEYGSVIDEDGKYYFNPMSQSATPPVFFSSLFILKKYFETTQTVELRPLHSGKIIFESSVSYFRINNSNINQIYIPEEIEDTDILSYTEVSVFRPIESVSELIFIENRNTPGYLKFMIPKYLIPMEGQKELGERVYFTLEIDVTGELEFQKLCSQYNPDDYIVLNEIAQWALATEQGTILITNNEHLNIGNVELPVLERMDGMNHIFIFVEPVTGSINDLLMEYGEENRDDQMYHGGFSYFLMLPKHKLPDLFHCIKTEGYRLIMANGLMYSGEIWLLKE
jgi:hypothetical protein